MGKVKLREIFKSNDQNIDINMIGIFGHMLNLKE